jgi:S1-C subfamily serine protease
VNKSNAIVSGLLGVVIILVAYSIILNPPQKTPTIEEISKITKTVVGDQTPQKELALTEIFEKTESGVVRINTKRPNGQGGGIGSGFVYDKKGHIITNEHVVDNAEKIVVTFLDGRSFKASLIGKDLYTDLAVLKVDTDEGALHPLTLGNSSALKVGEQVAAIGNPFGLSGSMTSGIVSQIGRLLPSQDIGFQIPDIVQTDAAINRGNSGGPLLNMRGEVVGINTAIQSDTGDFVGVGFAIPSKTVQKIIPTLIEKKIYHHPWVGISGRDIDPDLADILKIEDARGFLIINVLKDSPAEKAGLRGTTNSAEVNGVNYQIGGDIILSVDGITVRKIDDILIHLQRDKTVGDEMALQILRDERVTSVVITLEERPNSSAPITNSTNSTQK